MPTIKPLGVRLKQKYVDEAVKDFKRCGRIELESTTLEKLAEEHGVLFQTNLTLTGGGFFNFDKREPFVEFSLLIEDEF